MDSNHNEEEIYIEHLRSLFNELDPDRRGGLTKKELKVLSRRLSLMESQSDLLLQLSFVGDGKDSIRISDEDNSREFVSFEKFQESFVAVLSTTTDQPSASDDDKKSAITAPTEKPDVEPRVIHKGKAYGRRSQPDICNLEIVPAESSVSLNEARIDDLEDLSDDDREESFENDFHELPVRGQGDGIYFEANGQLRNPMLDRLMNPKSASTSMNESQIHLSTNSIVMQPQHFFTELDKNEIGFIHFSDLSEMWVNEGVVDPKRVLQLLDISVDRDKQVNAYELTSSLQDEANSLRNSTVDAVTQAILATYKHQIAYTNEQIEHHQALLGKMRDDLEKSELRNSILVDEADDRYFHIHKSKEKLLLETEKAWNRKLKQARDNFNSEKDSLYNQAMLERDALQQEIDRLVIREGSLRSTIEALQLDNDALEREAKELVQKLQESESNSARLHNDLEELLREKANMSNDSFNPSQEERFALIIKDYEAQCTALTDRNDELVAEIEKLRSGFLQSVKNKSGDDNEKPNSRKRARRRNSIEYSKTIEQEDTDDSDMENEDTMMELSNKISELEKTICKLENEKSALKSQYNQDKVSLRNQLESEFQAKLDNERKRMTAFEEMSKSDKKKAIGQALVESNKQRDELEKQIRELQESLQIEQVNTQQSVTNLCREFENDKAEIQSKNEELVSQLREEASNLQSRLEKEVQAHEMTTQQLKTDRNQHEATLRTHLDTISKFERSAKNTDSGDKEEIRRLNHQLYIFEQQVTALERDKVKILADHQVALDLATAEMHQTIEEKLVQRQQEERTSLQSELERVHHAVVEERQKMQQRIDCLKDAFSAEAEELKVLVDIEKAKLRKTLSEERENLKQRFEEEHKKAVEKQQKELSEDEKMQREEYAKRYEEIITNLKATNADLENELRNAIDDKKDLEKRLSQVNSTDSIETSTAQVHENADINSVLQSQVVEWRRKHFQVSQELANVKLQGEAKTAELAQIVKEKQECADKITTLEDERSTFQVQNARLLSRNIQLGVHEDERMAEEHDKRIARMHERLEEQYLLCEELRGKLKKYSAMEEAASTVKMLSQTDLKSKYQTTRHQLLQQMNKTKEMYAKLSRSEGLIKDLYCENAQLMRSLQITEDKHKASDRKFVIELEKNNSLTSLLRKICPEAV